MKQFMPVIGDYKPPGRRYRSERRRLRAMFSNDREYAARISGQPLPPVRHRRPKSQFGGSMMWE